MRHGRMRPKAGRPDDDRISAPGGQQKRRNLFVAVKVAITGCFDGRRPSSSWRERGGSRHNQELTEAFRFGDGHAILSLDFGFRADTAAYTKFRPRPRCKAVQSGPGAMDR
jgi:hypothetical protein